MTYLLLQTFLLLLSAYFAGAMFGCLLKRSLMTRSAEMAAVTARTSVAPYVDAPAEIVPLVKPREIDPVQPRIEVLARPTRKVVPVTEKLDTSRFARALTGPELNEGMPRKMIVEIRPAILKPVTGPAQPFKKPEPKVEAPKAEAPKAEPAKQPDKVDAPKAETAKPVAMKAEPAKPIVAAPVKSEPAKAEPARSEPSKTEGAAAQTAANIAAAQKSAPAPAAPVVAKAQAPSADQPKAAPTGGGYTPSSPGASPMMAGIAGASAAAAAAAAVAAAKAAAAAMVPRPSPASPLPRSPVVETKSAEPAKPATTTAAAPAVSSTPVSKTVPSPSQPDTVKPADTQSSATKQPAPQPPSPQPAATASSPSVQTAAPAQSAVGGDDLLRIRAIDAQTAGRLNGIGISTFEQIAHWTPADVNRVNQALGLTGRVDREQWIEQAQILAKGGETYYSRNRAALAKTPASSAAAQPSTTMVGPTPTQSTPASPISAQAQTPSAKTEPAAQSNTASLQPATQNAQVPQSQPATVEPVKPAQAPPAAVAVSPSTTSTLAPAAASTLQGKSVAEMATAAAAAIAAASASVTRGIRPIEPISPLTRANPNIVMPAKLSDALKDKESKEAAQPQAASAASNKAAPSGKADDLKRIRGVGVLIEKRLNALGVTTYTQVANWNSGDIDRISQTLEFKGRIERENWVEQARILSSGGQTEFSRRVDRGDVETSRDDN